MRHEVFAAALLAAGAFLRTAAAAPCGAADRRDSMSAAEFANRVVDAKDVVLITGKVVRGRVELAHAVLHARLIVRDCTFVGGLNLNEADLERGVEISSSALTGGTLYMANANVQGAANFAGTSFDSEVDLFGLNVSGDLNLANTHICNGAPLLLGGQPNSTTVGGNLILRQAVTSGPINAAGVRVHGAFYADGLHTEKGLDASAITVDQMVLLSKARFDDSVSFSAARVGGYLSASASTFLGNANFDSADVGPYADVEGVRFDGCATFAQMKVAGSLRMTSAVFAGSRGPCDEFSFNSAAIEGHLLFGPASRGENQTGPPTQFHRSLDLGRAKIGGELELKFARFDGDAQLRMRGATIGESIDMTGTTFEAAVMLDYVTVQGLWLQDTVWPPPGSLSLDGLDFHYIRSRVLDKDESAASQEAVLEEMLGRADFTGDIYARADEYLKKAGYSDQADQIYVVGRQREAKSRHWLQRYWDQVVLDKLVGYGRAPWRAIVPTLVLVVVGCFVFDPKSGRVAPIEPPSQAPFSRLWYSLDALLPIIGLGEADQWRPVGSARRYMRLHKLAGWFLIPLLVAAATGLIK